MTYDEVLHTLAGRLGEHVGLAVEDVASEAMPFRLAAWVRSGWGCSVPRPQIHPGSPSGDVRRCGQDTFNQTYPRAGAGFRPGLPY